MRRNIVILIVDDDKNIRDSMKDVLTEKGYTIIAAGDGKEALGQLEKNSPDLIILDMNMPNMGGIEFYSKICGKNNIPQFPVFVLTARAELSQLFKDFIIQGFMAKPFDFDRLLDEINHIVHFHEVEGRVRSKDIVIVDDNAEAGHFLMNQFDHAGYRTILIRKGVDAIVKLYEKPEGLVLMNLGLKDLAGDAVAVQLKNIKKTAHLPVFLYAHHTDELQNMVIEHIKEKKGVRDVIVFREYTEVFETIDQRIKEGIE